MCQKREIGNVRFPPIEGIGDIGKSGTASGFHPIDSALDLLLPEMPRFGGFRSF
jgi:hypothetical protein